MRNRLDRDIKSAKLELDSMKAERDDERSKRQDVEKASERMRLERDNGACECKDRLRDAEGEVECADFELDNNSIMKDEWDDAEKTNKRLRLERDNAERTCKDAKTRLRDKEAREEAADAALLTVKPDLGSAKQERDRAKTLLESADMYLDAEQVTAK